MGAAGGGIPAAKRAVWGEAQPGLRSRCGEVARAAGAGAVAAKRGSLERGGAVPGARGADSGWVPARRPDWGLRACACAGSVAALACLLPAVGGVPEWALARWAVWERSG